MLANTAHRLRLLVARSRLSPAGEPPIQLSISIGGTLVTPADTPDTLLRRADAHLRAAKLAGRNRVHLDPPASAVASPDRTSDRDEGV